LSRFSDTKPESKEPVVKVGIEGSFMCQTCNETVDDAFYLPESSLLAWECSQKHRSFIKDFSL